LKEVWLRVDKWNRDLVTAGLESGIETFVCPSEVGSKIRELGKVRLVSDQGELIPGRDVLFVSFEGPESIEDVKEKLRQGIVCLHVKKWDIVGLENLVALGGSIVVEVETEDELELASTILERGFYGVLIGASDPALVKKMARGVVGLSERITPVVARVIQVAPVGLGDRVCVDMVTMLTHGEGLLVGNSSSFLFLVHGETLENPYVAPRPFRVNAGGVHAYVKLPEDKTKYLCELKAGDQVLVVSADGQCREAVVGRAKIERRPLLLVTAETDKESGSIILQNAETIRLVKPDGKALSVAQLSPGDEVLVVCSDIKGRHFGTAVEETIWEH